MKTLRLILGDQLNASHSWFDETDPEVEYVMFELHQEATYTRHHIQKIVAFFLAMREFAGELKKEGHTVHYFDLTDETFDRSLSENIRSMLKEGDFEKFEYQYPDEWRLDQELKKLCSSLSIESQAYRTEHFLTDRLFVKEFFNGKSFIMESFYREMRRNYNILMDDGEPVTGKWNYDKSNRKKLPKSVNVPEPKEFTRDVSELVEHIRQKGIDTIGRVDESNFIWPVTRGEAEQILDFFVEKCLAQFGDYQDAMTPEHWSLFHSRLSFVLNVKLLGPLEIVRRIEEAWDGDESSISNVEGFIRQIIGWREYMRGVYWAKMPEYASLNYFEHHRRLPEFYWTGDTQMKCLNHTINQSLDYAYAHHIQRLMVTGNFALLIGADPREVDDWYLGIYIDALDWVEITNTRGMSQFADGGMVGTKPYVSSGSYIQKMSHYCKDCRYNVKNKLGDNACPFNSLYWNFIDRHRQKLSNNPRMSMMYRIWDKMGDEQQVSILEKADEVLNNLESL